MREVGRQQGWADHRCRPMGATWPGEFASPDLRSTAANMPSVSCTWATTASADRYPAWPAAARQPGRRRRARPASERDTRRSSITRSVSARCGERGIDDHTAGPRCWTAAFSKSRRSAVSSGRSTGRRRQRASGAAAAHPDRCTAHRPARGRRSRTSMARRVRRPAPPIARLGNPPGARHQARRATFGSTATRSASRAARPGAASRPDLPPGPAQKIQPVLIGAVQRHPREQVRDGGSPRPARLHADRVLPRSHQAPRRRAAGRRATTGQASLLPLPRRGRHSDPTGSSHQRDRRREVVVLQQRRQGLIGAAQRIPQMMRRSSADATYAATTHRPHSNRTSAWSANRRGRMRQPCEGRR